MNVWMVLQGLAPGMEHRGDADLRTQMPGIGGNGGERLSGGAQQDPIETVALFWKAISPASVGRVKTTWKYGTGNSSACRCASHLARASPWHFGQ